MLIIKKLKIPYKEKVKNKEIFLMILVHKSNLIFILTTILYYCFITKKYVVSENLVLSFSKTQILRLYYKQSL